MVFCEHTTIKLSKEHQEQLTEYLREEYQQPVFEIVTAWINEAYDQGFNKGKLKGLKEKRSK